MTARSVEVRFRAEVADFRRQMKAVTQDIDGVGAEAVKTSKRSSTALGQMVQSASRHEEAWTRVGGSLLGVGVAAAAGIGIAVNKFAEFDQAMSGVSAATHESAGNMKLLREAAVKAGADTQYSATEAAGAITNLAKAGVSTRDIIGGGLSGALDLAAAGALDVADAAEYTATTLTQFNLTGDKAGHVADVLAAGAGKAQGEVADMANAMKYAGVPAQQLGVSLEETAGTVALFAKNGVIGEQAGTSLRGILSSLTSPTKAAADEMDKLNLELFDGQGRFIGLAGVAGQLKAATADLTDEERAYSLGRIFGNEQLTAANVLVKEGEQAVRDWTAAVDDQGYAAETAALMTDNLRGDIERLGGALDTALITTGESSNGILREMVQALTGLIDMYGEASPVVKTFALGIGVVTAAVALAAGGFLVLAPRLVATGVAMNELAKSMPKTVGAIRGLGSALAGPLGLSLAVATVAFGVFATRQQEARARIDDLKDSLDQATGALTENTRATVYDNLVKDNVIRNANKAGAALDVVTDAALGNTKAVETLRGEYEALRDRAIALDEAGKRNSEKYLDLQTQATAYKEVLEGVGASTGQVEKAQKAWRDEQEAGVGVTKESASATGEARSALDEYVEATEEGTASAELFSGALSELVDDMAKAAGQALDARSAQRNYKQSLDDATQALKDNGAGFDLNTAAGRANQAALDDVSKSGWDLITSMQEQGTTQEDLRKTVRQVRSDFINQAKAMGMGEQAASDLADQLGLIPDKVDVAVAVETKKASQDVTRWITANNGRRIRVYVDTYGGTTYKYGPTGPIARAQGGPVDGPGTATSDSIQALLSNGEYVIRASARAKYGDAFFDAVNAGRFAIGGPVGHVAPSTASTSGSGRGGVGGVSINVGNIQTVDADAAARALLTRTRDAVALYGLDQIGVGL